MNSIEYNGTTFQVGQRVRVSTGQPQPPARFNRKLAEWQSRNYVGVIEKIEEPRSYQPAGALVLSKPGMNKGWISFEFHVPLPGPASKYTITEEAA